MLARNALLAFFASSFAVLTLTSAVFAAAPRACFRLVEQCDMLEVTIQEGLLDGRWLDYDCAGGAAIVRGTHDGTVGRAFCGPDGAGSCRVVSPHGRDWAFHIRGPVFGSGEMDLYVTFDNGSNWLLFREAMDYVSHSGYCSATGARP